MVNDAQRQWHRIDQAEIKRLREQMALAKASWEARIGTLPKEQQAMARAAMRQMAGLDRPAVTLRDAGKQDSVKSRVCAVKELLSGDQVKQTLCVASPETMGFSKQEFASVLGMYALIEQMRDASGMAQPDPMAKLNAVPIRIKDEGTGEMQVLRSVSQDPIDPKQFELPAGYTQRVLSSEF